MVTEPNPMEPSNQQLVKSLLPNHDEQNLEIEKIDFIEKGFNLHEKQNADMLRNFLMRFGWKSGNIVQHLNSKRAKKENLGEEMLKMDVHGSKGKTNVKSFKLLPFLDNF